MCTHHHVHTSPCAHITTCTHHHVHTVVLYAISAVYFAGVMVRLMLTLTPIVCVLSAIAISHSLDNYMKPVFSLNKEGRHTSPFSCSHLPLFPSLLPSHSFLFISFSCSLFSLPPSPFPPPFPPSTPPSPPFLSFLSLSTIELILISPSKCLSASIN